MDAATGGERVLPLLFAPLGGSRGGGVQWLDDRTLVLNRTVEVGAPNQLWRLTYPDGQLSPLTNDSTDYTGVGLSGDRGSLVTLRTDVRVSLWLGGDDRGDMTEIVPPTAMSARTDLARVVWARDRLLHGSIVNGRATIAAVAPGAPNH